MFWFLVLVRRRDQYAFSRIFCGPMYFISVDAGEFSAGFRRGSRHAITQQTPSPISICNNVDDTWSI